MLREKIADRHEKIADRHDWGLKLVHDGSLEGKPKDPERLDIVLVHGLGGHRETTWTAEDGSYWATNFPPPFTSNLRVFTFGYSGTPRSTGNKETVLSIAENLLELLSDERKQPHLKRRPLIWAGHNLGGNIIKQVLVETERPTSRHHEVYRSTAGVLFFATPHHGLNAKIFQQLILMANKHPRVWFSRNAPSALLDEMDQNDNRINDLLSRFRRVTNHLGFVSLLESALVPGLKDVVVNESSGTLKLPKEEVTKRDAADHIQICKFSNTKNNDPDGNTENNEFGVLAKQVQNFVTISSKAIADWDENRIPLERLGISKIRPKTRPVQPAKGTCESIAKECFNEWSTGAQGNFSSLWVKGPRGCGKAHLAKYMADNWKKEVYDPRTRPQRPAIVAHCSLNDMITEYRTASSVALCWLHQVLDADPTLTPHLRNEFNNNTAHNLDRYVCDWEENHIVDLWQKMISTVAKEVGFLVFIVDGLDKCNDPQVLQDLVNWVAQAAKKPDTILGGVQFQLLIFSNDTEKLRPLNHPPIHQLAAGRFLDDIKCAVRDRVDETLRRYESSGGQTDRVNQCEGEDQQDGEAGGGASSKLGKLLWNTVAEGEEKTHLWATVLMGEIKAANFPDKASLVSFLELLNRSPRGGKLDALYGAIVRRISSGRELKRHSFNVLFWLMHKIGIMTQQELQEGCGMLDAAGFRGADDGDRDTQRRIEETDIERTYLSYSTFRRALENLGGLVKIWRRGLCLIHDSFWDYFTTRADTAVHRDYRCSPKTAARVITRLCMDYLLLSRFKNAGPPATEGDSRQWENKVHKRVQENKFVRYASLRWTEHLQRSGSVFDPRHTSHKKLSRMRKLLDPRKGYMKSWTEVLWYWTKAAEGLPYPKERFPWELFVWKNPKGHWQPEQTSPPLRFSPPSFGNPESEQPQAASRQPDVERPGLEQVQADVEQPGSEQVQADVEQHGSEHPDPQQPTLEQPPSEWQIEGKNPKAWWRKKRVWLVVFALVIIIISGTVGGILGSRRSG